MKNKPSVHAFRFNFRRLLYNKKFTVTISIVLSIAIWFVVMIDRNPIRNQVFTDIAATVSIDNTVAQDMGLGIVSDVSSQKFAVTVSGPNYIVSSLKSEDFLISASVTDVNAAGKYTLSLIGVRNSSKTGYNFVSISPSTIDVTFDYIDTKEFTLVPKLAGVGADTGLVAETPVVANSDQSTIVIKGPRTVLDKISYVGSYYAVNKSLSTTQSYDSEVILYDESDEIIYRYASDGRIYDSANNVINNTYLSLSYTSVKVTQPISKKATLPVKPLFTNMPSGISYNDISWSIDHDTVTVIGTPDVVNAMSNVNLSDIDFRNIYSSANSFEVSEALPDGVKLFDNIEYFTVKIDTSDFAEKTFNVSDIRYENLSSELSVKSSSVIKNVKVCGPKKVIDAISSTDVYATVNLRDKSAGEHTVEAVIKFNKYNNIWQVGTYSTSINIK